MTDAKPTPAERIADEMFRDAKDRLRFQHEYTLGGFRALFLINGGAIIGLLTYAGNTPGGEAAHQMAGAFVCYTIGLALAVAAYLSAYASQAEFMNYATLEAYRHLVVQADSDKTADRYKSTGTVYVGIGVALSVLSLVGFAVGSAYALRAVTQPTEPQHHISTAVAKPTP